MTAKRERFNIFEELHEPIIIRVGNEARISATGRGVIRSKVFNGLKWNRKCYMSQKLKKIYFPCQQLWKRATNCLFKE